MTQKITKNKNILKGIIVCSLCVNVIGGNVFCTYADTLIQKTNIISKSQNQNKLNIVEALVGEGKNEHAVYYFSYNSMTNEQFNNSGLHLAVQTSQDGKEWTRWQDIGKFGYTDGSFPHYGGYIRFAVVNYDMETLFYYKGDLAESEKTLALSNIYAYDIGHKYNNTPYVMEVTPSNQTVQKPGNYKVRVKISEHLEKVSDLKINTTFTNATGLNVGISNIKIDNITEPTITGDTREVALVTFDLKTDETYGTHLANYHFQLEGAIGKKSREVPTGFNLTTAFEQKVYCYDNSFDGNMLAEQKNEIEGFNVDDYKFTPVNDTDSKIVVVKMKGKEVSARRLYMGCENDVNKFDTVDKISVGINFTDGFDKEAKYFAYRYVKQVDGTYKAVELKTEINNKGLRVFGENTLNQ